MKKGSSLKELVKADYVCRTLGLDKCERFMEIIKDLLIPIFHNMMASILPEMGAKEMRMDTIGLQVE